MKYFKNYFGIIITAFLCIAYFGYKAKINFNEKNKAKEYEKIQLTFELTDITKKAGIFHVHKTSHIHKKFENVNSWVASTGASLAVVDPTGEGWYDIYLTTQEIGGLNHYYKNNRDGTFTEIAEKLNIANVNQVWPTYRPIFFDYDRDGKKDLLLLSYKPRLFHNEGEKGYVEVYQNGILNGTFYGGANMVQLNNKGNLDLIVSPFINEDAYYNPKTTVIMPDNFSNSTNGSPIQFYNNQGNGKFLLDTTNEKKLSHIGWGHSVGVFDIRGIGHKDIWFPEDYSTEKIYFNNKKNIFEDISEELMQFSYGFGRNGMSIDFADVDNDGHPLIFVSHIFEPYYKIAGNNLWKWREGTHFEQQAEKRGVLKCGWAWGARFVDFDNDGYLDLIVVNGYISKNPNKTYWYMTAVLDASGSFILKDSVNWPKMDDSSIAGYQRSCLFYNNHKGEFIDVASKTDLKNDLLDGRGVVPIDIMNNGSPGLVVANQNGEAKLYLNQQKNNNKWIGFTFKGIKSNIDGWGAVVKVYLRDNKIITRELEPLNGHGAQGEDRILIGLGEKPEIRQIQIYWPSGIIQTLPALPLNHYHKITESE